MGYWRSFCLGFFLTETRRRLIRLRRLILGSVFFVRHGLSRNGDESL